MASKSQLKRWKDFFGEMTPEEIKMLEEYEKENGPWTRWASAKDGSPSKPTPEGGGWDMGMSTLENLWTGISKDAPGWLGSLSAGDSAEAATEPKKISQPGDDSILDDIMGKVGQENILKALAKGKSLGLDQAPGMGEIYAAFGESLDPYMGEEPLPPVEGDPEGSREPIPYGSNVTVVPKGGTPRLAVPR